MAIDPSKCYSNFTGKININKLDNYASQAIPAYITKDNTAGMLLQTRRNLGRVLFYYDKNLSSKNTISCPLHIQSNALRLLQQYRREWFNK
jgi:cytochrome c peroxidase